MAVSPARATTGAAGCPLCGIDSTNTDPVDGSIPLAVSIESSIDFDRMLVTGAGGARMRITPTGERQDLGGATLMGAGAVAGQIVIQGEPNRPVVVDLPSTMDLESVAGARVRIEAISSDLPTNPTLDANGRLVVNFGGDLVVTGEVDGEFRGNLRVDVNYL